MTDTHTSKKQKTTHAVKTFVIMLGNPGAGKSTLMSLYCGKPVFQNGTGRGGSGQTQEMQSEPPMGTPEYDKATEVAVDTPGRDDISNAAECAAELTKALKLGGEDGGRYKIIFVLKPHSGTRILGSDSAMMAAVLNSCQDQVQENSYSIIVNQMSEKTYERQTPEEKAHMNHLIINLLPVRTNRIFYNFKNEDLDEANFKDLTRLMGENKTSLDKPLKNFIANAPEIIIRSTRVLDCLSDQQEMDKLKQDLDNAQQAADKAFEEKDASHMEQLRKLQEALDEQKNHMNKDVPWYEKVGAAAGAFASAAVAPMLTARVNLPNLIR